EPIIEEAPQTFKPIRTYTDNCLIQTAKKGLILIGQQGGYIHPEIVGSYSAADPVDADGINLEPVLVPYWHYNVEANPSDKVVYTSLKPKLYAPEDPVMSIETQLSSFVEDQLDECLDDYLPFENEGFRINKENLKKVEATVGESSVNFLLTMNVKAEKESMEASFDKFFVKIPLELKHYYETADLIASEQQKNFFLERQGLEVLSAYSAVDPQLFPPQAEVRFEYFAPYSWSENTLQTNFKDLLISYVPMLRFLGSENFYYRVEDRSYFTQKILDNMVLPLFGAEDLQVNFDYFGWEPYFKTNSDAEGIIKPENIFISAWVLSYGQQRYETHYDASYPVLVTLNDEFAFDGEGYKFLFALESNIRNNNPAVEGVVRESYPKAVTSLACDNEQKNTEMLKTVVVDSFSGDPLEAVRVGFTIPDQTDCEIGSTDEEGVLESKYPSVYGGVVNFIQTDYLTNMYPIDTYKYQDQQGMIGYAAAGYQEKVVEMDKFKIINISARKRNVQKCVTSYDGKTTSCFINDGQSLLFKEPIYQYEANGSLNRLNKYYLSGRSSELNEDEEVLLTLQRISGFHDEVMSQEWSISASVKKGEAAEVQLVPGLYKVNGMLTNDQKLVIPKEERCTKYDVLFWEQEACFDFDEISSDKYLSGNLNWDTPENYLIITPEDLYTSQELTFFIPNQDIYSVPENMRLVEDLQVPGRLSELSKKETIRPSLEPEYIPISEE
ncbi:MAG: hypothetical protein ABIA37_04415, partial [Candidatus Woesearchaeota archaeon]